MRGCWRLVEIIRDWSENILGKSLRGNSNLGSSRVVGVIDTHFSGTGLESRGLRVGIESEVAESFNFGFSRRSKLFLIPDSKLIESLDVSFSRII